MEKYNWWTDPKNEEEVKRISWWNHSQNKEDFMLPISVIETESGWVAACNDETTLVLGEGLHYSAQGESKSDAIEKMFGLIRFSHEYSELCRLKYQRWVPFRNGDWSKIGGRWFVIFGLNFYFRYGKGMKGGKYIPFTKLNISFYSEWVIYKKRKAQSNKN